MTRNRTSSIPHAPVKRCCTGRDKMALASTIESELVPFG
jgi:hypothetical protein